MSVISTFTFTVYGESHYDLTVSAEERIAEFFEIDVEDIKKKLSYELSIRENQETFSSDSSYEAEVVVRGRDV